jgi:hypothetical protein
MYTSEKFKLWAETSISKVCVCVGGGGWYGILVL